MNYNQVAEFGLQRLMALRLTTPGGLPAPTLAPEMFPCVVMENDRPEWGWLKGELTFSAAATVAAVAGENSRIRLANPAGSGILATVLRIRMASAASSVGIIRHLTVPPTLTSVNAIALDSRTPLQPIMSRCVASGGNGVGVAPGAQLAWLQEQSIFTWDTPIILAPGGAIDAYLSTVNVALPWGGFIWRERGGQPGELG